MVKLVAFCDTEDSDLKLNTGVYPFVRPLNYNKEKHDLPKTCYSATFIS